MHTRDSKPVIQGKSNSLLYIPLGLFFLALLLCSPSAHGALVAYWNFDEASGTTVFDTAGNTSRTNNGAFGGAGSTSPNRVTGRLGGALSFAWAGAPGSGGQLVTVPYHTNLTLNGPFTVSYWYRPDAPFPANTFPGIMRIGAQSTTTGNNVGWGFFRQNNMVFKRGNNQPGIFGNMNLNQWNHLAIRFDGNLTGNNTIAFLNGVQVNFAAVNGWSNVTATTVFEMGRMDAWDTATLDDLALWGNEAVAPSKIRSLYTVPTSLFLEYNLADLRAVWGAFDAGAGGSAVVKGTPWNYTSTLPGSPALGDAYISGGSMYIALGTGTGVVAPLTVLSGTLSPGGIGTVGTLAPTNDFTVTNANLIFDLNASTTPGAGVNDLIDVTGGLTIANSRVSINPLAPLPGGTYRLFNYSGARTGSLILSNTTRYALALDESTPNQINLTVSGTNGSLQWASTGSGVWDLATMNWSNLVTMAPDRFYQGDSVLFDDSGAFQTNITVSTPVFPRSITVNSSTRPYIFTGAEQIGGAAEGITKEGTSALVLSTPNTFSGDVRVNAGTLRLGNSSALGSTNGQTIIAAGATLDMGGINLPSESVTVQGAGVGGGGAILNTGAALSNNGLRNRVTLLGDTVFGGNVRWDIINGRLEGNGFTLTKTGTSEIALINLGDTALGDINILTGTLTFQGSTGMGDPTKTVTVNTNAALAYWANGATVMNKPVVMAHNGIMRNNTSGGTDVTTNLAAVTLNGNATFEAAANIALLGTVQGPGQITKVGAGTLLLGGANTYASNTLINAGRLALLSTGSIANSPRVSLAGGTVFDVSRLSGGYSVANGQALVGSGSVHGSLNVPTGGTVLPGVENIAATLTVSNALALSGGTLTFDLAAATTEGGGVNDLINAGGNLDLTGTSSMIVNPLGILTVGNNYTLINYSGALSGSAANLNIVNNTRYTFAVSTATPNKVTLTVTGGAAGDLTWVGGTPGAETLWDYTTPNFDVGGTPTTFFGGDNVLFDDFAATNVVDLVGSLTPASMRIESGDPNFRYIFQGSGKLSGNSSLTKLFSEMATIANSGVNDYVGPTDIQEGALQIGLGGTAGNLGSGPVTNNATLILNRSDNLTIANTILGGAAGNIIKSNANLLILTAQNSNYSGTITAAGGTIRPGNTNALGNGTGGTVIASGATLDVNAQNLSHEGVTVAGAGVGGSGAIINSSGTGQNNALRNVTLTGNTTVGGTGRWDVRASGSPATASLLTGGNGYSLTKVGANQVSLVDVAVDPALGDINVNAGIFAAELGTLAGNPSATLTVASNATLQFFNRTVPWDKMHVLNGGRNIFSASGVNVMSGPVTLNAPVTFEVAASALMVNGPIGGPGALTKIGAGSLWLGSDNTYPGTTLISAGPLYLGLGTNAGSVAGPIINNVTLGIYRSDVYALTNPYSGSGSVSIRSANGVILSNTTMNVPGTMVVGATNAGKLIIPAGFTGLWGNLFLGDSPNVPGEVVQLGGAVTVSSQLRVAHWPNNASTLTVGGGTLTLTATPGGVVNPAGQPEQAGIIYLGIDGTGTLIVTGGVVRTHGIVFDGRGNTAGNDTFTLNGGQVILGASGLKSGGLDANASYAINLGGGTIGSSGSWTSALAMTFTGTGGNTTFDPGSHNNVLAGALTGPGGLTKVGAGTLVIQSNATYLGDTTVSQGTLSVRGNLGGAGGLLYVDGGTVNGTGTINVATEIVSGGTIAPGPVLGKLTINNTLSLGGNAVMEVAKNGSVLTNDLLAVSGAVTYGGTLTVVNTGDPLSAGNTFDLFNAPSFSGSFTAFNLPPLSPGLAWDTSQLAVDGTIKVGTRPLTYEETIQADGPIAYYRFSDTLPVATNSGSLGAAANGTYNGDATVGVEAPRSPAFVGFETNNTAAQFDGAGDYVTTISGLLNGKPQFTVSGWMRRNGAQANRTGLWGQNDIVEFGYIANDTVELWTDNGLHVGPPAPIPDAQWAYFAIVSEGSPGRALIYTNGILAATRTHTLPPDNTFAFNIGGGGIFDTIAINGNYFNGQIDEVAVFTNALSAEEIAGQYFTAVPSAPIITRQPQGTNVFEGADVILTVEVTGTAPFSYQWLDSGTPIPNQTGSSLVLSNVVEADSRAYSVLITNLYGQVTSDVADVVVTAVSVPTITQHPNSITRYAGSSPVLTVAATGGSRFSYQWQRGGVNVPDATNSSLVFSNLQPANAGDYQAIVSNTAGSSTSSVATVTVIMPAAGTPEELIVAAGPMAFWRFNETNGPTAFDYYGGNHATYVSGAAPGSEAPRAPQYAGFESNNLAAQFNGTTAYVMGPTGFLNSVESFTMIGWIRRAADQANRTGLFGQNDLVEFGYINNNTLEVWTDNGLDISPNSIPNGEWAQVAVVGDGDPGTVRMYTNGLLAGSRSHSLPAPNSFPFNIGGGGIFDSLAANGNYFNGQIDEVAVFNKPLTAAEIFALYLRGSGKPVTLSIAHGNYFVEDTKPVGTPHDGVSLGASWARLSNDGSSTRTGVVQFAAAEADQITVAPHTDFDSPQGTIMFWVRSAGTAGPGNFGAILLDRRPGGPGGPAGDVIVQTDAGTIFVQAASGTGAANSFETTGNINNDQWHHVAYVYDQSGSGRITIYVDAIVAGSQTNTVPWSWTPSQRIELGRSHDGYWKAFNGAMDDFRIYNRALTFDEILAASEGAVVDPAALKVRFDFRTPYGSAMNWPCGTLQCTEALGDSGTVWTDVPGATSPYFLNPRTEGTRFYRIRY